MGAGRSTMEVVFRCAKGQGEVRAMLRESWRTSRGSQHSERWSEVIGPCGVLAEQWRMSPSGASATGQLRAGGHVLGVSGEVAELMGEKRGRRKG